MKNPIEPYLSVDERSDGVYIKVSRLERDSINIETLIKQIEKSLVMNLETDKLKDVFQRARGLFEKIGPHFEYYDEDYDKYLQLSISPLKATMKVSSACLISGKMPSEKILFYFLKKNGIKHGIKTDQVKLLTKREAFDSPVEVAVATPPENGSDAQIKYLVMITPNSSPQMRENGSVDYRNIQTFVSVAKDQVIVEKIPLTQGITGTSVTGEPIPSEPGNDLPMPGGKNTQISADGKHLISLKTGVVYPENGLLHIIELLHIKGDVDYSVGNIKYTGDVLINGNVQPGFTIEADGEIHIKGDVESAHIISRNGCVIIERSLIGKGDTVVKSKKGIQLSFAQSCSIITEGTLLVDKYLLHCDCVCEKLEVTGVNASVVGGTIKAEKYMQIKQAGSEKGIATKLLLFDKRKDLLEEKIKSLNTLQAKLQTDLEPIERQLRTKASMLKKTADAISDRIRDEVKKWVDAHNALNQKIKYVQSNIEICKKEILNLKNTDGYIQIGGFGFPGVEMDLYGVSLVLSNEISNKKIHLNDNRAIQIEG